MARGEETEKRTKEKRGKTYIHKKVTSLSSLAAGGMQTEEASGCPGKPGKAPLALLLRTCPPTCLYAPLVPDGCSCGCSWRFGEEGVEVSTRVLSAVTSACRTSIWERKGQKGHRSKKEKNLTTKVKDKKRNNNNTNFIINFNSNLKTF